ncbi:MAG TPA: hypothetical protein PLJ78_14955 [Anaerolineae bacterium]|nr:hypothetical protein [Anaerolineae bacterium]HQK15230.1 hypothetical protein [Anaerolineae bacterium]
MKRGGLILLIIALTLLWAPSLAAQEGVSVSPRQLSIAARRGQTETRLLLIRAAEPVNDLRIIPLDLNAAKGDVVLPAEAIRVALPATTIAANDMITVPVTFNLTNVSSGQFTGELLINYTGQSFTVPVTVAVKDQPWLPLAALVAGVALGIGVSTYRAQGRPRDEVLVRLGQIRTQMKADKDLEEKGKPFYTRLDAHLVDVEVALEAQQWEKAQEAVRAAETLWVRWRRARPDWLVQVDYYNQLNTKLTELGENLFYISEIKKAALDVYRALPDLEDPNIFRAKLEPLTKRVNDFIALNRRITSLMTTPQGNAIAPKLQQRLSMLAPDDSAGYQSLQDEVEAALQKIQKAQLEKKLAQLAGLTTKLPAAQAQSWSNTVQELQTRMASLTPTDSAAYLTLESDIDAALQQVESLMPAPESTFRGIADTSYSAPVSKGATPPENWLSGPPGIHVQALSEEKTIKAGKRLQWFTWLTYAVAVVFLALAGFVELYGARPDFGVNGIGDYFTLLAWGFGAEATRASIADMVQGWNLTTGK